MAFARCIAPHRVLSNNKAETVSVPVDQIPRFAVANKYFANFAQRIRNAFNVCNLQANKRKISNKQEPEGQMPAP